MVQALPYVMAAASAVSGISQYQNTQYQSAVATQNADLLKQQAEREAFAASQDMLDQDAGARAQIAEMVAQLDASGINSNSGTMLLRRSGAEAMALRDRERLSQKKDIQLENTKRQESSMRAEAKALKKAGKWGLLSTVLSIPTSFLSGATMVNQYKGGQLALSNPSYV
jgi:hypothetical protein